MRNLGPEWLTEIDKRGGIRPRVFFRFTAKNRQTGADETLCLWTGADAQQFSIGGQLDTFYGAGAIMTIGRLKNEMGTTIRRMSVTLAHLTPEVTNLIRLYNVKRAPVTIWSMLFSTESGLPLTPAVRRFKGYVDKAPITTAEKGGTSSCTVDMFSVSRNLSRRVPSKFSNDNQKLRNSADNMLQYIGVTGLIQVAWGSHTVTSNPPNINTQTESILTKTFGPRK